MLAKYIAVATLCFIGTMPLTSQDLRTYYTNKFEELKRPIDSLTKSELGTIRSTIGYDLENPYYGIFPADDTLQELNFSFNARYFRQGDTFFVKNITYPRFNYGIQVRDTTLEYFASDFDPSEHLTNRKEFLDHLSKLKTYDIDYVLPLWGILYCNELDDSNDTNKMEKWWLGTQSHDIYIRLDRNDTNYSLSVDLSLSVDKSGNNLEYLGCSIPEISFIELSFSDKTKIKKYSTNKKRDCRTLKIDLSDNIDQLNKTLRSITISLSESSEEFEFKSNLKGDALSLKCDCLK